MLRSSIGAALYMSSGELQRLASPILSIVGSVDMPAQRDASEPERSGLSDAIRRRREELFGPKPGVSGRETVEIRSAALNEQTRRPSGEELSLHETKYAMELGAHRETTTELLAAKDALIARLEEILRDRDHTIGQLRAQLHIEADHSQLRGPAPSTD